MKKILGILLALALTISCTADDSAPTPPAQPYTFSDTEIDLFNKINHFRDSVGVGQLTLIEHVSFKCQEHNQYMIDNNVVNHDYFYDRSTNIQQVCHAHRVGEIIAYNYYTNNSVMAAWINSPCHDTIIRTEFNRIGIAITVNPTNNRKYYTVIFID